ncbi:MAG: hypothetical protein ACOZQL_14060 [Myxococcota bacterium]
MNAPAFDAPAAEWLVFADALQQQGDPRGELIALLHAKDEAKLAAHVQAHAGALLGAAAPFLGQGLEVDWQWGFLRGATLEGRSAEGLEKMAEAVLASPYAAHLQRLKLIGITEPLEGRWYDGARLDLEGLVARLAKTNLTSLALVDQRAATSRTLASRDFDPGPNLVDFGPLTPVWSMPALRELELVVADVRQLPGGAIASPTLEALTVNGLRFARAEYGDGAEPCEFAAALGAATLPRLQRFEARLCEEWVANFVDDTGAYVSLEVEGDEPDDGNNEGSNWDGEFGDALAMLAKAPLRRLALTSFDSTRSLLDALKARGLAPTLTELDLSDSTLGDDDVEWFEANAALIKPLRRFVAQRTGLTEAGADRLRALGLEVVFSTSAPRFQPWEDPDGEGEAGGGLILPTYRYVVGME